MSDFLCDYIGSPGFAECAIIDGIIGENGAQYNPRAHVGGARRGFASQAWRPGDGRPSRDSFGKLHDLHSDTYYLYPDATDVLVKRRWSVVGGGCDKNPAYPPPSDPFGAESFVAAGPCTRETCFVARELTGENSHLTCWLDVDPSYRTVRLPTSQLPIAHISLGPGTASGDMRTHSHALMNFPCWGSDFNGDTYYANANDIWKRMNIDFRSAQFATLDADGAWLIPPEHREPMRIRNAAMKWLADNAGNMPQTPGGANQNMDRLDHATAPTFSAQWSRSWNDPTTPGEQPIACPDLPVITDPDDPAVPYPLNVRIHGVDCTVRAELVLTRVECFATIAFFKRGRIFEPPAGTFDTILPAVGLELVLNWAVRLSLPDGDCTWVPVWDPDATPVPVTLDGCDAEPSMSRLEYVAPDGTLYEMPRHLNAVYELGPVSDSHGGTADDWPALEAVTAGGVSGACCGIARKIADLGGLRLPGARTNYSTESARPINVGYITLDWNHAETFCGDDW